MEENTKSLIKQQAWESAPKMHISCLLYAIFYTFCLYQNRSGITFPFYVGGTLFFFGFYLKKSGVTVVKDNRFWTVALILLGVINCTTDSYVLIGLNRLLGIVLFAVWMLQMLLGQKTQKWRMGTWCREIWRVFWGSLCEISAPFTEAIAYRKAQNPKPKDEQKIQKRNRVILSVVIGIAVSIPILCIVGVLLLCADAVFYQMFCDMFDWVLQWHIPEWISNGEVFRVLLMVVICFVYTYGMLAFCRKRQSQEEAVQESRPLLTGSYLYRFCCCITFFVCIFNMCLVPACHAFFARSRVLNLLLAIICGCTYIMIASSAYRMILYINCYGMTFLRLAVLWTLAVMVMLTAGMIYDIHHEDFMLFRYLLIVVTLGYLGFAMLHPDYWVARYNIATIEQGGAADAYYLQTRLSTDAAPAIAAMDNVEIEETGYRLENLQREYFKRIQEENEQMHIRNWNLSRAAAGYYAKKALVN